VDKDRCEELDIAIEQLVYHASQLSHYVEKKEITGLECLVFDRKFKQALKELREERARLWRRVGKEVEEETEKEEAPVPLVNISVVTRNEPIRVR